MSDFKSNTLNIAESIDVNESAKIIDSEGRIKEINERLGAGPKKTRIQLINHDTGEVVYEGENKCVISGSIMNAAYAWGVVPPIILPSYNDEMNFDHDHASREEPYNMPIMCLFGVADSGCGSTPKDVYVAQYTDRITPAPAVANSTEAFTSDMLMPFRWVPRDTDLNADLRKYYFGRKTYENLDRIGYFLKAFDTKPQMHLRYADGTQITENMYISPSDQLAECYIETRLRITKLDFRDYFDEVLGWDKARISTLALYYAWYDDTIDNYKYYQDIYEYTKLNFSYQWLYDEKYALDVIYQIYY